MKIDKSKVKYVEKPDNISHEDIKNLLNKAHAANPDIDYSTTDLAEEEVSIKLKLGGAVFVALYDNIPIGTMTINIEDRDNWYAKGTTASVRYIAVLPEYSRNGVASGLVSATLLWAKKHDIKTLLWSAVSSNYASVALAEKHGFHKTDFYKMPELNHTSVRLLKYLSGNKAYLKCWLYYHYRKTRYSINRFIGKIKYRIRHR